MHNPDSSTMTFKPKDLPLKFGLLLLKLIAKLPYRAIAGLGQMIGLSMLLLSRRRRRIATTNFRLCFPDYSKAQRRQLLIENFKLTGIGFLDTAFCWYGNLVAIKQQVEVSNTQQLREYLANQQGVLVLGFHLTSLELGVNGLGRHLPISGMYRKHRNQVFERAMVDGRKRNLELVIERDDVRAMVKALKSGKAVWYAADQDYGAKHSTFANFFDIPTATITATSRFVKMAKVPVIPMTHSRCANSGKLLIKLHPAWEDFAALDTDQAAVRVNQFLEHFLKAHPADYLWTHRRFKTRPKGEPSFYDTRTLNRVMSDSRFQKIVAQASLLEGNAQQPKLFRYSNGDLLRVFYKTDKAEHKALLETLKQNPEQYQLLGLFQYPPLKAEMVHYRKFS